MKRNEKVLLIGAIASGCLIPANMATYETVSSAYQTTRTISLILDTIVVGLTLYVLGLHFARVVNAVEVKLLKFLTEVLFLI